MCMIFQSIRFSSNALFTWHLLHNTRIFLLVIHSCIVHVTWARGMFSLNKSSRGLSDVVTSCRSILFGIGDAHFFISFYHGWEGKKTVRDIMFIDVFLSIHTDQYDRLMAPLLFRVRGKHSLYCQMIILWLCAHK